MVEKKERETVGKICADLMAKADLKQGVIDTRKEMEKHYIPEIQKCIEAHKNFTVPYYIVVINRKERLIANVMRQIFTARLTLPTPDYDQTVFKYIPSTGDLIFLWTVPDKNSLHFILKNQNSLPAEQKQLIKFCVLFSQNKLDSTCGQ